MFSRKLKTKTGELLKFVSANKLFFILFPLAFVIFSTWLIAFYPGTMSFDSIYHWKQVDTLYFDGATSFFYTVLMLIGRKIWDSPALISFAQIAISSFTISFFLNFLHKNKIKLWILILLFLVFVSSPSVGIYNVTIWKDVIFAQCILLLGLIWVYAKAAGKGFFKSNITIVLFSFFIVLIGLLRLNGLIYIIAAPALFFILGATDFKTFLKILFSAVTLYLLLGVGLGKLLNVDNKRLEFFSNAPKIQIMAAAIRQGVSLSDSDRVVFEKLVNPEEAGRNYKCVGWDSLWTGDTSFKESAFYEDENFAEEFSSVATRIILKNVPIALGDRACLFAQLTGLGRIGDSYLYHKWIDVNNSGLMLKESPIKTYFEKYLTVTSQLPFRLVFWTHALSLSVFGAASLYAVWKRNYSLLGFCLLILLNVPVIFVLGVSKDFRYLYMIDYASYFLPGVFLLTENLGSTKIQYKKKRKAAKVRTRT